MVSFSKVDGWSDSVWIHGRHNYKLPFLGRVFATNGSKFSEFNADSFLMKKLSSYDDWKIYSWLHHKSQNAAWLKDSGITKAINHLITQISGNTTQANIRIYSNYDISVQVHNYDSHIALIKEKFEAGAYDFPDVP